MLSTEIVQAFRDGLRLFNDLVFTDLTALQQTPSFFAYASLIFVGFAYGALHAVGPGHGKVVVSSYVLANENSLKRGLVITALSALMQALVALAIGFGFFAVLDATRAEAEQVAEVLEIASFTFIGFIGAGLVVAGLRDVVAPHRHGADCCCGHAHAPQADRLKGAGRASMAAMIVSIGMRPCSGALLLLFFAGMARLYLPGALAVLAMAVGTALTTSLLVVLAVKARKIALRFVDHSESKMRGLHAALRFIGGVMIIAVAALFLVAQSGGENAAAPAHPLYKSFQ